MAIYNGREVQVQALPRNSYEPQENIQITDKEGQIYNVKLSAVSFTEEERKNLQVETGKRFDNVRIISDKDLKDLRDSQDKEKNEQRMKDAEAPKNVTIQAQGAQVNSVTPANNSRVPADTGKTPALKSVK